MVIEFVLALCQKRICSWVGYRASPDGFNNPPEHAGSARRTFFCPSLTGVSRKGVLRTTLHGEPLCILRATRAPLRQRADQVIDPSVRAGLALDASRVRSPEKID